MNWKPSVYACQYRDETIFPCSDGLLRYIYTVNVWEHQP